MRILYHHRIRSKDGQAVHVDALIHAFRARGDEVLVVEPPGFRQSALGGSSASLDALKRFLPKTLYELAELAYNIPAFLRLAKAWRAHRPDILYERGNLYLLAGAVLARLTRTPLFLEINAPLAQERGAFGGLRLPRVAAGLEAWVWRSAAYALPVTSVLAGIVQEAGVPAGRIAVIPNGIDLEDFAPSVDPAATRARRGLSGKIVLGFTGFMRDWHGLDAVVALLAAPDTPASLHLLLIGDGPAKPELERQAERLGLGERVTFLGLTERSEIPDLVAIFDIALQPRAVALYASPLKLFEYMALGMAIVAPGQANIREVLTHEENALLYDLEAPETMAAAILRLSRDPALRARLGEAARTRIAAGGFTWRDNARRIAELAGR